MLSILAVVVSLALLMFLAYRGVTVLLLAPVMGALAVAEQALGGSLGRLMMVAESYPELKADATRQSLSEELTSTENRLGFARQAYNDQVLDFNDQAAQFPAIVVARLLGFPTAPMLESTRSDEERAAPKVQF